jgi:CRISPR/Cas system-associated exonuclease Cas4 (RecB family)
MFESQPDINRWETGGRTKPADDLAKRYLRGKEQALAYREWALSQSEEWRVWEYLPDEAAVEIPFEVEMGGVLVKGYIDQVIEFRDGEIRPRDLKTGNKLPESEFQLAVYRLALLEVLGILPRYGDYYMAKNTAPTKPYDLSIWTPELVGEMFRDMDRAVEAEIFLPNKGDDCRICLVREFCKLGGTRAHEYLGITRRGGEPVPPTTDFQFA